MPEVKFEIIEEFHNHWESQSTFKLILCGWMLNEVAIVFAPTEISHNSFYVHAIIYLCAAIFIGIPLVYSEMCLAQFTKCNAVTMWNYFPIFHGVGYATFYIVFLKSVYILVLASWYLEYSFYSALDPPPWYSCEDFDAKCMVKRVNISTFQHCIEMQLLSNDDCGMKTASNCFFEREIGDNTTVMKWPRCCYSWKMLISSCSICLVIYVLSLKGIKVIQLFVKIVAIYIFVSILFLFCIAMSTSGTWNTSKVNITWERYNFSNCVMTIALGFLSSGTGLGIIINLGRDSSFRSPVNMTSITTSLLSVCVSIMYALIAFSGIKTMSFYHGEEENVIEVGNSIFFFSFASMSEILSYFNAFNLWGFMWFSSIFLGLFINEWIMFLYLRQMLFDIIKSSSYERSLSFFIIILLCSVSCLFYCSDITPALNDSIRVVQTISCVFFSISLYWIYGYKKHSIDIIFMIGVKPTLFWKLAWIVNPIVLSVILYTLFTNLGIDESTRENFVLFSFSTTCDHLVFYVLLGIYLFIIIIGMLLEILSHVRMSDCKSIFYPTENWGPRNAVLFKSRKMFVPEIMTREFLYKQVRIHGYGRTHKINTKQISEIASNDSISIRGEWNALTSN